MHRSVSLILLLGLLATPSGVASETDAPTRWSGHVVLEEPFVVREGETLVIEAGSIVESGNVPPQDGFHLAPGNLGYLHVLGTLLVEGTAGAPVTFRTNITLEGPRTVGSRMEHARMEAADFPGGACALASDNARFTVANSTFSMSSWNVCIRGGEAQFLDNEFHLNGYSTEASVPAECDETGNCETPEGEACFTTWKGERYCPSWGGRPGALIVHWGNITIQENTFANNRAGVYLYPNASAIIRGNAFRDNSAYGVELERLGGSYGWPGDGVDERFVLIENNTFEQHLLHREHYAGYPSGPAGVQVQGRLDEAWPPRDEPRETIVIRDNLLRDNHVGLQMDHNASGIEVLGNRFVDNEIGLVAYAGTALVKDCYFNNTVHDLHLWGSMGRVQLVNTTFDPERVYVEGTAVVEYEGGIIRSVAIGAAVGTILLSAIALATEAGRWLITKGLGVALYSRLAKGQLLSQPTREHIHRLIHAKPGVHLREVSRQVGSYGAAVYHLARLEREGFVRSARDGTRRRFYPAGQAPASTEFSPLARSLLDAVRQQPGIAVADAARRLGCSRQLANHHARRLEEYGAIRIERPGHGPASLVPANEPHEPETRSLGT